MLSSKNSFLDHVRWLRKGVNAVEGEAIVALDSWHAYLRLGSRHLQLFPQFDASIDGVPQYQDEMTEQTTMFAGWLPYQRKRWEIATDKLAFKRHAKLFGLHVPECWDGANLSVPNIVVKRPRSSFGQQVFGPYRSSSERPLDRQESEYYEEFISGTLLKIWFWDADAICAEIDTMPTVSGDGFSNLNQKIIQRAVQYKALSEQEKIKIIARGEIVLRYFGRNLNTVLKRGERQIIEFRYGTSVMHWSERQVLDFKKDAMPRWSSQLKKIGQVLFDAIPQTIRGNTLFTVDAILGEDERIWLLEMNSNPTVHPLAYPTMIEKSLGSVIVDKGAVTSAKL
jgi:hypothetical protein